MRRSKMLFQWFEDELGLSAKAEKIWFRCVFILLVLYVEFAVYAQNTVYEGSTPWFSVLCAVFVIPACIWGVLKCSRLRCAADLDSRRGLNKNRCVFLAGIVFLLTFFWFFAWQKAYWPGSFSPDSIGQYGQATLGEGTWQMRFLSLYQWLMILGRCCCFPAWISGSSILMKQYKSPSRAGETSGCKWR